MLRVKEVCAVLVSFVLVACGGGGGGAGNTDSPSGQSPDALPTIKITTVGQGASPVLTFSVESKAKGTLSVSGECGNLPYELVEGTNEFIVA